MIKVLHITSALDGGGVERILYDYAARMRPEVLCDFAITDHSEGILEAPLREQGSRIFRIPSYRAGLLSRIRRIRGILDTGKYDVVHDHSGYKAFASLYSARRSGVSCRIAHSHQADVPESFGERLRRLLVTRVTKHLATQLYACGVDAGRWMWGAKDVQRGRVQIMTNAIDWTNFQFSSTERESYRRRLDLEKQYVIGNVARFSDQKNHEHLLRVFAALAREREDASLLLVGDGELMAPIKELVGTLGLADRVLFLGVRDDVASLLSAMDVFVLPSKFEGLPVVLLEVQANGLPVIVSDVVTEESLLLPNHQRLSLSAPLDAWVRAVLGAEGTREESSDRIRKRCDVGGYAALQKQRYLKGVSR